MPLYAPPCIINEQTSQTIIKHIRKQIEKQKRLQRLESTMQKSN